MPLLSTYKVFFSGIKTSANRPSKVISQRGKKQVGFVSSGERGRTVTALCCCNAEGRFIPPAMVFPRMRMNDPRLLEGAPIGTLGLCSASGWMNSDLFLTWLKFFIEQTKPSKDKPITYIVNS